MCICFTDKQYIFTIYTAIYEVFYISLNAYTFDIYVQLQRNKSEEPLN